MLLFKPDLAFTLLPGLSKVPLAERLISPIFNPSTTIRYDIPNDAFINIVIYDITGREIARPISKQQSAGYHSTVWNGTNQKGETQAAGIYFYQIQTKDFIKTKKMLFLK